MGKYENYSILNKNNPYHSIFPDVDYIIYKNNLNGKILCYLLFMLIIDILIIVSYG